MSAAHSQPPAAGPLTPLPWRYTHDTNPSRGRGRFLVIVSSNDPCPIADVNRHRGPQSEANAAFIVEACNAHAENQRKADERDALIVENGELGQASEAAGKEIERLAERCAALEGALRFYASESNWDDTGTATEGGEEECKVTFPERTILSSNEPGWTVAARALLSGSAPEAKEVKP